MSTRRLIGTAIGMAAIAGVLTVLTPSLPDAWTAFRHPQALADSAGPDVLVLHMAGLLAWLAWAWGALGLLLTAGAALPGLSGRVASGALRRLLPAGARRAAAVALGVGLGIVPPVLGAPAGIVAHAAAEDAASGIPAADAVPDWPVISPPATAASEVPDWPRAPVAGEHVVLRGDCLWEIAERRLAHDGPYTTAEVATAVHAWWQANADVIGPDPDRLLPGQVLRPPALP
jgi:hypothetical protein